MMASTSVHKHQLPSEIETLAKSGADYRRIKGRVWYFRRDLR